LRGLDLLRFFPRPPPPFSGGPRSDLFTVAQALAEKTVFDAVLVAIIAPDMRLEAKTEELSKIQVARLERSGVISFIKTEQHHSKAARYLELLQSFDQFY
jgi:hypothetical protein